MSEKTCPIKPNPTICTEDCAWYVKILYKGEQTISYKGEQTSKEYVKEGCSLRIIAKALESLDRCGIETYTTIN